MPLHLDGFADIGQVQVGFFHPLACGRFEGAAVQVDLQGVPFSDAFPASGELALAPHIRSLVIHKDEFAFFFEEAVDYALHNRLGAFFATAGGGAARAFVGIAARAVLFATAGGSATRAFAGMAIWPASGGAICPAMSSALSGCARMVASA